MNSLTEDLALTLLKSQEEFPIDFDDAWQWLDYSRKNNAKAAFLGAGFVDGIDFQVLLIHKQNSKGGRPYEQIKLTIDCFKSWAMMANTPKGRLARRYFLECEKRLKEMLSQQSRTNFSPEKKFHPYIERVEEALKGKIQVPENYWCVLLEAAYLLIYVDKILGFPVDRVDLLDGSIGLAWSKYREDKEWVGDRLRCKYQFPDGRWCNPWCYELHELPVFRLWLDKEYKHRGLPSYLNSKYGSIIKI